MDDIILIGYGGNGKSVEDTIVSMNRYNIVGYVDIKENKESRLPYLGTDEVLNDLFKNGIKNAAIGIGFMGNSRLRDNIYSQLIDIGFDVPTIIDPSAVISKNAKIGQGVFIGKKAVVNAYALVGKMSIINTGAIVEHECIIGDFSHVAVGTILCGNVCVGDHSFIGAGSTVIQGIRIGSFVTIGAGSSIIRNVENGDAIVGVPGRKIN